MRASLAFCILLLTGCNVGEQVGYPGGTSAPDAATGGTGGSTGSGGSTGGGSSPPPPAQPVVPVNPTGIWDVTGTINGKPVAEVALIAAGKYFALASADPFGCADIAGGPYTAASGIYAGSSFVGSGTTLLLNACTTPTGQGGYVGYKLNGSLMGTALNLSLEVGGNLIPTLGATMDKLYSEPSSLATLAGNWDDAGNTLTVNPDGTFFEQQGSGCVVNGTYTIIDATHNLYGVALEITNCSASSAGIAFTGLGYLDDSDANAPHFIQIVSGPDPANSGSTVLMSANLVPQ